MEIQQQILAERLFRTVVSDYISKTNQSDEALHEEAILTLSQVLHDHLMRNHVAEEDIRRLLIGNTGFSGMFAEVGRTKLFARRELKPTAALNLFCLDALLTEWPQIRMVFQTMGVSKWKRLRLDKHLKYGDSNQQLAAFRVLLHIYQVREVSDEDFLTVLHELKKPHRLARTAFLKSLIQHVHPQPPAGTIIIISRLGCKPLCIL